MTVASIPNIVTSLRIAGTFGLIFTRTFDIWFYVIYIFTGITDAQAVSAERMQVFLVKKGKSRLSDRVT